MPRTSCVVECTILYHITNIGYMYPSSFSRAVWLSAPSLSHISHAQWGVLRLPAMNACHPLHDCDLTTTPPFSPYVQLNNCVRDFSLKGGNSGEGNNGDGNNGDAVTLTCGLNCSACASRTECTHSRAGCMMEG